MNLPTATLLVSCPDQKGIDLVVLPKYMQILTPKIVENFSQIINIHHSFLPAFAGANPQGCFMFENYSLLLGHNSQT